MADKIKCPSCNHEFDVTEALSGKMQAHFQAEYERKIAEQAEKFNKERDKFQQEKEAFNKKKENENELFKEKLEQKVAQESAKIQEQVNKNFEGQLKSLQAENEKKREENRALKRKEIDLLQRENKLKEQAQDLEFKVQKDLLEKQTQIEEKAKEKERESMALKEKEYQKKLDDQKKLIDEMKRKAEQGSMQMQGEIQELALEELLSKSYPFDQIEEVGKGIHGADCIQTVINSFQKNCGSIVYESKRTKKFSSDWIDKLKQDQINCKADLAVIVTETFPSDMDRFGERSGVWICGFSEVKSVSFVLRELLIKTQSIKSAEENKGDKMGLLYTYLTSNEFIQNINRIIENYDAMIQQLNYEKKTAFKNFATREKQIWGVQENINGLFGSIKGIVGKELETSTILNLPNTTID